MELGMNKKMIKTTIYPFGGHVISYTHAFLIPPIMIDFRKIYRCSSLVEKLAKEKSEQNNTLKYKSLLKILRGETLGPVEVFPEEYKLTHSYTDDIDDRLNKIAWVNEKIKSDLQEIIDLIEAKGYQRIDLGDLHWKLIVDVESVLFFCRSILDIFARLTKVLYIQMGQ
jgi:hypothetical protein